MIVFSATAPEFQEKTIGTKVLDCERFLRELRKGFPSTFATRQPALVRLPRAANDVVSCEIGRRTKEPDDYVLRAQNDHVSAYLRRSLAAPVSQVDAIVWSRDAYLQRPQRQADIELLLLENPDASYVITSVMARPKEVVRIHSWKTVVAQVANRGLAAADTRTVEALAYDLLEFDNTWCTVAD